MKWVKTAIGAVIAISVIPMIVFAINKISTGEEVLNGSHSVTIEIDSSDPVYPIDPNIYDTLLLYSEISNDDSITNFIDIELNNTELDIESFTFENDEFKFTDTSYTWIVTINNDSISGASSGGENTWIFTFDLNNVTVTTNTLPKSIRPLIVLIPLIFTAGVLYSIYPKKRNT